MEIKQNIKLAPFTSWQVGGPADYFCQPESLADIEVAIRWAHTRSFPLTFLGGGSNVLISDLGVEGLLIHLARLTGTTTEVRDENLFIRTWAGTGKSEILKIFLKHQLAPALFLAGLPGDVGGGIVMNAGVAEQIQPREFHEIVEWVNVLTWKDLHFEVKHYKREQIHWDYRHSSGWQPGIVTEVGLKWPLEPDPQILVKVKEANRLRLTKQPLDLPSCGSVFKNPEGLFKAAQLIDSCQLKGTRFGDAEVSTKHANFIVNRGEAKATDIWNLINHIQKTVFSIKQIQLTTEVVRLGRWSNLKD